MTVIVCYCLCFTNKPLQSPSARKQSNDATYNLGLVGGGTLTQWIHFGGTNTPYQVPITKCIGFMGGLSLERMLNSSMSLSIEGMYAIRSFELTYDIKQFPIAINEWNDIRKSLDANYNEIFVQAPLTFYLNSTSGATIRPYVFAAPRVTVIQDGGKTYWHKENLTNETSTFDTVGINTVRKFKVLRHHIQHHCRFSIQAFIAVFQLFSGNF